MSAESGTETAGATADHARVRRAALVDFASATVIAMLAFPFPFVRASVPRGVFVGLVIGSIFVGFFAYLTVCLLVRGKTLGMYLFDLALEREGRAPLGAALAWAFGWLLAILPTLFAARGLADPAHGLPARFSGVATVRVSAPESPAEEGPRPR